jgi:hypothetical protein
MKKTQHTKSLNPTSHNQRIVRHGNITRFIWKQLGNQWEFDCETLTLNSQSQVNPLPYAKPLLMYQWEKYINT